MKSKLIPILQILLLLVACQSPPNEPYPKVGSVVPTTTPEKNKSSQPSGSDNLFVNTSDHLIIQQGNGAPRFLLDTEPSQNLVDNHTGPWIESHDSYADIDFVFDNGFKRMRIGRLFGSNQQGWPISLDTLSPAVDNTIDEYVGNGIKIVLTTPTGAGLGFPPDFQNKEIINTYLKYLAFVAAHFKGRIEYYEILNEPLYMSVDDYVKIAEMAVEVIREVDPDAKIIIGAVSGDWLNGQTGYGVYQRSLLRTDYLFALIQLFNFEEVQVDGVSWHPFYDNLPTDPYYQAYPEVIQLFQEFTASRRFNGEYFADEICWVGYDEPNWNNGPPIDPEIAAKYQTRAITEHRALGVNVTINKFWQAPFMAPIKNLNNVLAGTEPTELPISLATSENFDHLRAYGFTLPNGEFLVALWINDNAVEEDTGLDFTLNMHDFSADRATGIDVYYGFEQELVMATTGSDLVLQNLMVKDYPTIIKFSNASLPDEGISTQLPQGKAILVENTSDSGLGSFRQALMDAQSGDTISFDPIVFDPRNPATISILSGLPEISQGFLTIDASNAGVILDGSNTRAAGFNITSEWNTIQGLHIINFPRPGIIVWENAAFNTIGGDPKIGSGPLGQGNLISGNNQGIALVETEFNTIIGNQIGVEFDSIQGNNLQAGIFFEGYVTGNIIGSDNIIVNNSTGIDLQFARSIGTTITRNLIFNNATGIRIAPQDPNMTDTPETPSVVPDGTIRGVTCPACKVEFFSGGGAGAEFYEGSVIANLEGNYRFAADSSFSGSNLIATVTTPNGSTSIFSHPANLP